MTRSTKKPRRGGVHEPVEVMNARELSIVLRALVRLGAAIGASGGVRAALTDLGDALDRCGDEPVVSVLKRLAPSVPVRPPDPTEPPTESFADATREQIGMLLARPADRTTLERVARQRFGMSAGSTQRLSKAELTSRIADAMRDEAGHEAIARQASQADARATAPRTVLRGTDAARTGRIVAALRPLSDAGLSVYALSRGWGGLVRAIRDNVPPDVFERLATGSRDLDGTDWAAAHAAADAVMAAMAD